MRYVQKPVPVEAILLDNVQTAMDFLKADEIVVLRHSGVHINTPEGVIRAEYGEDYLLRGPRGEVWRVPKDIFETAYLPLDAAEAEIFAHRNDTEEAWTVECKSCGPIGVATNHEEVTDLTFTHVSTHCFSGETKVTS